MKTKKLTVSKLTDTQPVAPKPAWGVYDTVDHCWIGNKYGPLHYDEEILARAAATICCERFGEIRFRPGPLPPYLRFRDEIQVPTPTQSAA